MSKPNLPHLKSSKDLETTHKAVREGFIAQAFERNRRATPYIAETKALRVAAVTAKAPDYLLNIPDMQSALSTAAGLPSRENTYLLSEDKKEAIAGLIENFPDPAGKNFVEELVFRFLLMRGGALGVSLRNIDGISQSPHFHKVLSRLRYCIASDTCSSFIALLSSMSAMVRATLSILLWPRAETPSPVIA